MKTIALTMCALAITAATAISAQRVVVAEDMTGTWCQYCPAAANGLDQLYDEVGDSLLVLALHGGGGGDPFITTETQSRINWYSIGGYPTVFFDGYDDVVGSSGSGSGYTNYEYYRPVFDSHKAWASPFEIDLRFLSLDFTGRTGQVEVKARNTSGASESGTLHFFVVERGIPYVWQGMSAVDFVVRDMVPDGNGDAITVPAGDSATFVKSFAIGPSWVMSNCRYAAFIQRANKVIVQGAQLYTPSLVQQRYALEEHTGNGNGYYEPNETLRMTVWVKDRWAPGTGAKVQLESADPYISITNGLFEIGNMSQGDSTDNSGQPFEIQVSPSATIPEGHQASVAVHKKIFSPVLNDTVVNTDTVSFLVGSPTTIFAEGFEAGLGGWGKGYIGVSHPDTVFWDTTSLEAHGGSYCATDSREGVYRNSSNNYLYMTSGLDLRGYSTATLLWWDKYEVKSGDNARMQVSTNGGGNWSSASQQSGTQASWAKKSVSLASYCGTVSDFRMRFMLSADASDSADGWYVDDIAVLGYVTTGVAGRPAAGPAAGRGPAISRAYPNPSRGATAIEYQLACEGEVSLSVYDACGRLVRTLESGTKKAGRHNAAWDGRDDSGNRAANGVYFFRLTSAGRTAAGRMAIIR